MGLGRLPHKISCPLYNFAGHLIHPGDLHRQAHIRHAVGRRGVGQGLAPVRIQCKLLVRVRQVLGLELRCQLLCQLVGHAARGAQGDADALRQVRIHRRGLLQHRVEAIPGLRLLHLRIKFRRLPLRAGGVPRYQLPVPRLMQLGIPEREDVLVMHGPAAQVHGLLNAVGRGRIRIHPVGRIDNPVIYFQPISGRHPCRPLPGVAIPAI